MHVRVAQPNSPATFDVHSFGGFLQTLCKERRLLLPRVGGNFAVHVPDVATWVVVTQGANPGVRAEAGDEQLDFAMMCPAEVLAGLFGEGDVDLEAEIAAGRVELAGDPMILARFLDLNQTQNMVALRSEKSGTDKPAARRPQAAPRGMR